MLFKLLGRAAAWDRRLNRIRINFIPLNLAVVALVIGGFAGGLGMVRESLANSEPRPVTIADIVGGRVPEGTFVSLTGLLYPDVELGFGKRGRDGKLKDVRDRLIGLVEQVGPAGILVRVPYTRERNRVALTGMVRSMPRGGREALEREASAADAYRFDVRYMLAAGQQPSSFSGGALLMLVCAALAGCLGIVHLKRHVFFRPEVSDRAFTGAATRDPIDMRITGRLRLNGTARRFIEVNAAAMLVETGEIVFNSNIDASTSYMGMQVKNRAGEWGMVVPATGPGAMRFGRLYFGGDVRAAVQFLVLAPGRRAQTVTLSFGTADQRDRFVRAVESRRGRREKVAA